MKFRVVVSFMLAGMLAVLATAQTQSEPQKAEKKEPLYFLKIAADVAGNVQSQPLNGYLAIYLDQQNWAAGLKDGDLGPFLKVKEAKPGRSAACLFSADKDAAICVYFDGDTPFGVAAVRAGASGRIEANDVAAAYKAVSKEMLKKGAEELRFDPSDDVATDDGQPLPAFLITSAGKFRI